MSLRAGSCDMYDRDKHVSEIAYFIWEAEGRPAGQANRHWRMALSAVEQEEAEQAERKLVEGEPPGETAGEDVSPSPAVPPPFDR